MILFDFVAYKIFKMIVKGKQFEEMEFFATAGILSLPLTLFITSTFGIIEKIVGTTFVDSISGIGKIPFFIVFTLPIGILVFFYLRNNIEKIEIEVAKNKILNRLDRIPDFIIFFSLLFFVFGYMIIIREFFLCIVTNK
jgi:hypothetical protein